MSHTIFTLNEKARENEMTLEEAIYEGEIETVHEFKTMQDAMECFETNGYDVKNYGCE